MPINGLDTANQSGIASRNGSTSRLRRRERAFTAGKSVALAVPNLRDSNDNASRELIIFMFSTYP
jgi:hypothetical protein